MATTASMGFVDKYPVTGQDNRKVVEKHHVSTVINYYDDPGDGSAPEPVRISEKTVKNERPTIARPTTVYDVTGEEEKYTLDGHGFQFLLGRATQMGGSSSSEDFFDEAVVKDRYYPEAEALLKEVTGASRILIFDHKTRVGPSNWHRLGEGNRAARGPLFRAHVDQSYAGAEIVLRRHVPAPEVDDLLARGVRWMIVNIWRPIKPITRDPLAVADAHSIAETDLVAASILYRDGSRDETWTILPPSSSSDFATVSSSENNTATSTTNQQKQEGEKGERKGGHKWYYKHNQKPDEPLLIKCFDSATTTTTAATEPKLARRAPHSAFVDPTYAHEAGKCRDRGENQERSGKENGNENGNGPRESIELRALVFYD